LNRVNNVNPLLCPKSSGSKRIIAFIEDKQLVKKILKHMGLWDIKRKPPPWVNVVHPPMEEPARWSLIICDDPSSPSADDPASPLILRSTGAICLLMLHRTGYLIDADRSTQRHSTGGSWQVIRLKSTFKKCSCGQIRRRLELAQNFNPALKMNVDNNARFCYRGGCWFRLIDTSICWAVLSHRSS
jgi:hypothetical protein